MAVSFPSGIVSKLSGATYKLTRAGRRESRIKKYNKKYGELTCVLNQAGTGTMSDRKVARKAELIIADLDLLHTRITHLKTKMGKMNAAKAEKSAKFSHTAVANMAAGAAIAHDYTFGDKKPSGKHDLPNRQQYSNEDKKTYVDQAKTKEELMDSLDKGDYDKARALGQRYNRYP